jgi:LPXTG-site transpeptidase (sortase) family protein
VAGAALIAGPLYSVWQRGNFDQSSVNNWTEGGSQNLKGAPKSGSGAASTLTCGSSSPGDYALVQFADPAPYGYAGVAGDGDWSLLDSRSMVHYHGSADPGQQGNMIIAFHREPTYQHIDQLAVGGVVTIQDKACHTFKYQVTQVWQGDPGNVNQLVPTTGHDLTLITCTPWWVDSQRMVWRATQIS